MRFTILIPHWKAGKMTAYCVSQVLKKKGRHEVDIIVIDNNSGDGTIEYLRPYYDHITLMKFPKDRVQSHGIAFDFALQAGIKTDFFITLESDGYPINDTWLDYYEDLIKHGVECAGSVFQLSGGEYLHPCGAMYKYSNWKEAMNYCKEQPYMYFPNMALKEQHACHLMVHETILEDVLAAPEDFVELPDGYRPFNKDVALERAKWYRGATYPFHNGMGSNEESVKTYGARTVISETPRILLTGKKKFIKRLAMEPGQWFCYWHFATGKNVVFIPTTIKWLKDAVQQEYTLTRNGLKHLWGVSSFFDADNPIANKKRETVEQLYSTI